MEGLVALVALSTVMMLSPGDPATKLSPDRIYAQGLASFVRQFGINPSLATAFVLLAFATFIFDTLDVATRLGRYILQELFGWQGAGGRVGATLFTLALPAWFVTVSLTDPAGNVVPAWKVFWMVFGASNQLLAALTLLGLTAWLRKSGKPFWFALIPGVFMMGVTLWALGFLLEGWLAKGLISARSLLDPVGVASLGLMTLALALLAEGVRVLRRLP